MNKSERPEWIEKAPVEPLREITFTPELKQRILRRMQETPEQTFWSSRSGRFTAVACIAALLIVLITGSIMNPQWFAWNGMGEEHVIEDPGRMAAFDLAFLQSNLRQGLSKKDVIARLGNEYTQLDSFVEIGKETGEFWRYDYGAVNGYKPYDYSGHEGWADVVGMQRGLLAGQVLINWDQDLVATAAASYVDASGAVQFAMIVDGNVDVDFEETDV